MVSWSKVAHLHFHDGREWWYLCVYSIIEQEKKKNDHNLGSPWWRLIIEARSPIGRYRLPSHNFLFRATPKSQTQSDWEKEFRATCRDEDSDEVASEG
jgi:hypothetical protein